MDEVRPARDWIALSGQKSIDELMQSFGAFHDACIREIHVATGHYVHENLSMTVDWKTTVHMLVQRQWRPLSAIEMRFEELVELHLFAPEPGNENIINNAALLVRDGIFYWADNAFWTVDSPDIGSWLSARKAYWRDASEWLGDRLRYRTSPT